MPYVKVIDCNGQPVLKTYYIYGEHIGFDEDFTHEYKGHVNFSHDEVPSWAKETRYERASRQPVSRAINGFLNTGSGGTVHLGVKDEGTAFGLFLTSYKMDHIIENLRDLMNRFKPTVEPHRYNVEFIPVVQSDMSMEDIKKAVTFDPSLNADNQRRLHKHQLRSSSYCWCDKDLTAQCNAGLVPMLYVVEVQLVPWDPADRRNKNGVGLIKAHPFHEDECGNVFIRRNACTTLLTTEEIENYAKWTVNKHCNAIARQLMDEKAKLLELD